jgi:glycerol-3-phosphate acyltransferase PlsX
VRVAVDLLGGDQAPDAVLEGVARLLRDRADVQVLLVGPPELATCSPSAVRVIAAADVVAMDEDPAHAVRVKRDATIAVAMRLVADGTADAVLSAGHTGASMASAVFTLGRLPGMSRPALAAVLPSLRGPVVLLDVGANTAATPDQLVQFARVGVVYARHRLGLETPRVGLLSVGSEDGKGDLLRRRAAGRLAQACDVAGASYVGNVEGHAVPLGSAADVVVTDGFTGNVLLKGIEGTVEAMGEVLAGSGRADPAPVAEDRRAALRARLRNYRAEAHGGAVLLGVRGVVVVAHGASRPAAVASGIGLAADIARAGLPARLEAALAPHQPAGTSG